MPFLRKWGTLTPTVGQRHKGDERGRRTPDLPRNLATDKLLKAKPSTILQGATATCLACGRQGLEPKWRRDNTILCLVEIANLAVPVVGITIGKNDN